MIRRTFHIVCVAVIGLALGMQWQFRRRADAARRTEIETRREIARVTGKLAARARDPQATKQVPMATATRMTVPDTGRAAMEAQARKSAEERETNLLTQADLQVLFEERQKAIYTGDFATLFRHRGVSVEQQEAFVNALAAWDTKMKDLEAIRRQQGLSRDDPVLKAQRAEAEAAVVRAAESAFGPEGKDIVREETRLTAARHFAAAYGGLMSRIGEPVTPAQLDGLAAAFAEVAPPKKAIDLARLTADQWDRVFTQAQTILSPSQWAVLESTTPPGHSSRWDSILNAGLPTSSSDRR